MFHEQAVTGDPENPRRYADDMVWRVRFRDRSDDDSDDAWLYLVLVLEFQAEVDFMMPLRIRNYVGQLPHGAVARQGIRRGEPIAAGPAHRPLQRNIALERGARVIDLVTPGASQAGHGSSSVASRAAPLFAGDGYLILDMRQLEADDLPLDNAAALLAALEYSSLERVGAQTAALYRRLAAPALAPLRELMLLWARQVSQQRLGHNAGIKDMAEMDRLYESGELETHLTDRALAERERLRAEGVERGIAQGLAAERDLLVRLAALKFGADASERLAPLLAEVDDTERLAEAGEWIIDCATGDDLIARIGDVVGSDS